MAQPLDVKIHADWKVWLKEEFEQPYFHQLKQRLHEHKSSGNIIYPPGSLIFNAFDLTPPKAIKAVIIGQDPYHNPDEAMGLCFSVARHVRVPPSLKNIYKELYDDLGILPPQHGDLTSWAQQGVLLLNSVLTVEKNKPASHQAFGWQQFTDRVIQLISERKSNVVFILWGNYAKSKSALIDGNKHLIIQAPHPSPLARGAFFGHRPFSKTNDYLHQYGIEPIDWKID